jgi:hypothetical protein
MSQVAPRYLFRQNKEVHNMVKWAEPPIRPP